MAGPTAVRGLLGGGRALDRNAVEEPLSALAAALGTTPDAAAEGVLAVADTAMERALRVISVERGYDPADFAVVAFGGAGALHVAELTARLGTSRALVPPDPGLLSAYGMLASPVTREGSRTVLVDTEAVDVHDRIRTILDELEGEARASMVAEGLAPDLLSAERTIDARYRGQSFELGVPEDRWVDAFHEAHAERYGYRRDETPVEAVTLRVTVSAPPQRSRNRTWRRLGPSPDERGPRVPRWRDARGARRVAGRPRGRTRARRARGGAGVQRNDVGATGVDGVRGRVGRAADQPRASEVSAGGSSERPPSRFGARTFATTEHGFPPAAECSEPCPRSIA